MSLLNRENILSFFLGLVLIWFGVSEVSAPEKWVSFVPDFLGDGGMIKTLVMVHGAVLLLAGFSLIFNFKRRFMAGVVAILLLGIIAELYQGGGINAIMVRDVGLFGMALALVFRN